MLKKESILNQRSQHLDLSVVIPVYNEAACIKKVALEWKAALVFQKASFQIVFINDGSTDNGQEVLEKLCRENKEFVLINQKNAGHGNALLTGYHQALASYSKYVFQVDSDDQFLASDFAKLWKMREASPFLLGVRQKRNDPWFRLIITKILKLSLLSFFGTKINDANIPFRLMNSDFLRSQIHCLPSGIFAPNIFLAILASKYLGTLPQCPVNHIERKTGQVSLIKLGLVKACVRSLSELIKFSFVLNYKVSQMELELNQTNNELSKLHA